MNDFEAKHALKFNDFTIGQTFETNTYLMGLDEVKSFAEDYDPQAMHTDEVAAKDGPFGSLTASGWHTLSLTMKLMAEAKPFGSTPLVGVGVDKIAFKKPVFPETEIVVRARVINKRASTKKGRGYIELELETLDVSNNEIVVRQNWIVMVPD